MNPRSATVQAATTDIARQTAALRRKIPRALAAAFDARAKAWQAGLLKACPTSDHACLAGVERRRHDELAAIDNQISENAPPLTNLSAYVLTGTYKVVAMIDPDRGADFADAAPLPLEHFPAIGSTVTGQGAQICFTDGGCRDIGWTKHRLDWLPQAGDTESSRLKLPKQTPVFSGLFDDKVPPLTLIARPDGHLLAERDLCNARGDVCRIAYQEWVPVGTATMVDLSH